MTAVSNQISHTARTRHRLPGLIGHEFGSDLRCFRRNTQSVFFTLVLPVLFLVIFASIFRNATVQVPGGTMKESVYYVPAIITFGLIAAAFSNLTVTVVRSREAGI
jgi:ABC-2 type transport system permease protein